MASVQVMVTSPTDLRSRADLSSTVLSRLPAGFNAVAVGCENGWVEIEARPGGKFYVGFVEADRTTWNINCD